MMSPTEKQMSDLLHEILLGVQPAPPCAAHAAYKAKRETIPCVICKAVADLSFAEDSVVARLKRIDETARALFARHPKFDTGDCDDEAWTVADRAYAHAAQLEAARARYIGGREIK